MEKHIEKKVVEHIEDFPKRQKAYAERFESLEKIIKEGLSHPQPSTKTIAMIEEISEKFDQHIKDETGALGDILAQNERLVRVIFGDVDTRTGRTEPGLLEMVKELHEKFVQANGVISFLKLIITVGGVSTFLYYLFKRF